MFLCTLSVVVWLAVANSNGQIEAIGTRGPREHYNVPQEIRNRVPVDFAATNLRKSRLKYQSEKNILQYDQDVNERPKGSIVKRISLMKYPTEESRENDDRHDSVLGSRKRSNQYSWAGHKKPSGFRTNTEKPMPVLRRETILPSSNFKQGITRSRKKPTVRSNVLKRKPVNSFENIKKAINALPQQMVKVVRDDIDCVDDPTTKVHDIRGPPCTFSARWPGSGGNPWLWLNNVIPQNWELFYN